MTDDDFALIEHKHGCNAFVGHELEWDVEGCRAIVLMQLKDKKCKEWNPSVTAEQMAILESFTTPWTDEMKRTPICILDRCGEGRDACKLSPPRETTPRNSAVITLALRQLTAGADCWRAN